MRRGFAAEFRRVLIFTGICVLLGLLSGYLAWTLIIGGACYMAWNLWQIRQLDQWLISKEPGLPPDANGIWGDIFDRIYYLQQRQNREKKRLRSVVDRIQDTTTALPDAVVLLDDRGNMTWWNQTATELLGFRPGDKGSPLTNFVRNPRFVRYFDKEEYKDPITLASPINENKQLQIQITRYGQGQRLVMVRDITRIHRLESMRKDFVANVSHELRTPLTVIKGYLETLESASDGVPKPWLSAFKQMQQQTDRMTLLVNDLITLSRLETEDLERQQTSVALIPLLQTICADARVVADADHFNISLNCEVDKFIRGNQKELHSAFSNLITNAMKYSPKGGEIKVRIYCDAKQLHVAVSDEGIGIDPKHISRLTERFYRVDNSRSINTGGTGLGLAIVKHVLLRHDGELHVDSSPGKGSTFTCSFSLRRCVEEA